MKEKILFPLGKIKMKIKTKTASWEAGAKYLAIVIKSFVKAIQPS